MKKDFYTILNVSKEDSCETIKNKCRPKFMTLHPDKGGKSNICSDL
jgi:DnaJ-class molecular chaperone